MENRFVAWVATKSHVVVIALGVCLAASGAAIAEPCAIKKPTAPPRDERPEILDSGLQCDKPGTEKGVDVLRPRGCLWIDGAKLGQDGETESRTGSGTTPMVRSTVAKPSDKASRENAASYLPKIGEKELDEFIHGALIGGVMMVYRPGLAS